MSEFNENINEIGSENINEVGKETEEKDKEIKECENRIEKISEALKELQKANDTQLVGQLEKKLEEQTKEKTQLTKEVREIAAKLAEIQKANNHIWEKLSNIQDMGVNVSDSIEVVKNRDAKITEIGKKIEEMLELESDDDQKVLVKKR